MKLFLKQQMFATESYEYFWPTNLLNSYFAKKIVIGHLIIFVANILFILTFKT